MEKTDQAEKPRVSLYDYFVIRLGIKPDSDFVSEFEKVCINSPDGKRYKMVVDAAVNLTETMFHAKDDYSIGETIANHLYQHLIAPKKAKKK